MYEDKAWLLQPLKSCIDSRSYTGCLKERTSI